MKKTLIILSLFTLSTFLFSLKTSAQISIVNASTTVYNITPKGLLEVNVMNFQNDLHVVLEGKILNTQNEPILDVISAPFILKKGMNVTAQMNLGVSSSIYSNSQAANYIKTSHTLPSGKYTYCAFIKSFPTDIVTDEYCETLEAEISSFLFLVSPPDKEEIETKYPVLIWTHSEPFSANNAVDYYRMIVTDLNPEQSAEAAVNTNVPIYMKNYLSSHNVLYPVDAKELQAGKKYAWQVQKLENGTIVNKTEAWEFKLKMPPPIKENKYATVKKTVDGTFYLAEGNKIFFRFDEGYGSNLLNYKIYNEKQEAVTEIKNKKGGGDIPIETVKTGYNQFCIDLNNYKIGKGIYLLEVTNEKSEVFKLKFSAE
ncbi:MAG: hypothetical protein ACYDCN_01005 [Bacteroidia bacterium]